jgi:putative photosynthetic complex assembly protein 2
MILFADASLFALFVWWFSTGAILFLDGLPRRTFKYSMAGATVLAVAALWGLRLSAGDATPHGAFISFACGLSVWAWQEISFYMGIVTGPRKKLCEEGCAGWKHFGHALGVSLWHEISIVLFALVVVAVSWGGANQVGMWTFMVLWWMHESARLNVMLGVRNLNEEFLPDHLFYLRSFLRKRPMNVLFPVSVTVSTAVCAMMLHYALAPGASEFTETGMSLLAAMMALAILEHWFLVLPFPTSILWRWGLASRPPRPQFDVQVVTGFLGAGKTTYMKRLLAQAACAPVPEGLSRTIVVLNDFAAVGVDGSLLAGHGADVVQLPDGCVCCALKADLADQLADIAARYNPARVLIEPSGVADTAALLRAFEAPEVAALAGHVEVVAVLDAGAFTNDFARMGRHLRAQIATASRVVLNKADLAPATTLRAIAAELPAEVVPARFGLTDETAGLLPRPATDATPQGAAMACRNPAHNHETARQPAKYGAMPANHDADQGHEVLGLTSWSTALHAPCDADGLQNVLEAVISGRFGQVERMKGVVRSGAGWLHFDVAGGRPSIAVFAPNRKESGRVVAIGRHVDEERLRAAFDACAAA